MDILSHRDDESDETFFFLFFPYLCRKRLTAPLDFKLASCKPYLAITKKVFTETGIRRSAHKRVGRPEKLHVKEGRLPSLKFLVS